MLYQKSIFFWLDEGHVPFSWRPWGRNQHKENGRFSKIRDLSLQKKKRRGGGKPGTTKQKKLHHIHPQKLHQKTEFLVVKQTAPPKKKITREKFPRFSWRKISSSGHRTCKSCSKGFSAKGSSSSSWRSEEGRCYRIRINDGMWVTYDERWWNLMKLWWDRTYM